MILLNSKKINSFSSISMKIKEYEEEINFSGLKCNCGSCEFTCHGTYERNIIELEIEYKIKIKRVKCKKCNKTHALIPCFLLPYYQTDADTIIDITQKLIEGHQSTVSLEKETKISRQKLNQWRELYNRLKNIIRETFEKIIKINLLKISENRIKVYHNYKPIFLMQITT